MTNSTLLSVVGFSWGAIFGADADLGSLSSGFFGSGNIVLPVFRRPVLQAGVSASLESCLAGVRGFGEKLGSCDTKTRKRRQ